MPGKSIKSSQNANREKAARQSLTTCCANREIGVPRKCDYTSAVRLGGEGVMRTGICRVLGKIALGVMVCGTIMVAAASAQAPKKYEPTIESLDQHPLPEWYDDAKLGIFIHFGLYSVPGWAPLKHPEHD